MKQTLFGAASASLLVAVSGTAQADIKNWACVSSYWDYDTCWSAAGVPLPTDDVIVAPVSSSNTILRYDGITGTRLVNSLLINSNTANTVGLTQTGGSLSVATNTIVGSTGTGSYSHSGGSHVINNNLVLGDSAGGNGTYNLSGTGSVTAGYEFIGVFGGTGTFNHSGGTNAVTRLTLGTYGSGTYNLSGTGSLTAAEEYIGRYGSGTFNQSGGTNTVTNILHLTQESSASGTYNLSGGSLSAPNITIGQIGTGTFNQSGGTNTAGVLYLGEQSGNGNYLLSGAGNLATTSAYIGNSGTGTFTQSGGTHTVSSSLTLGNNDGSIGTYYLSGTGSLTAASVTIGNYGTGTFNQSGGTNTISSGGLRLGYFSYSNGTYELSGTGSLTSSGETIGLNGTGTFSQSGGTHVVNNTLVLGSSIQGRGTYNLSGGSLSAGAVTLGNSGTGTFNQSGGTHVVNSDLRLGYMTNSRGTYNLTGTGSLTAGNETIGGSGIGTFNQSGGTNTVNAMLVVGDGGALGSGGTYYLNAGSLSAADARIGNNGTGTFTQSGGTHTVSNNLTLGNNAGSNGAYNLNGGTLTVGSIVNGAGTGTLNIDGGTLNLTGASIDVDYFNVGNIGSGIFTLTGGTHNAGTGMVLGNNAGSNGTYNLNGGTLNASSISKGAGTGTFNLNGGTLNLATASINVDNFNVGNASGSTVNYTQSTGAYTASSAFTLGSAAGANNRYTLNGGSLTADSESIGGSGIGTFTQYGGTNTANALTIQNLSTYNLYGGTFAVNNNLVNNGTLAMKGGMTTGTGALTNNNLLIGTGILNNIGGVNNAGTLNAKSGNFTVVSDSFTNTGLVKNSVGSNLFIESTTVSNLGNIETNSSGSVVFDAAITNTATKTVNLLGGTLATPTLTNAAGGTVTGFGTLTGNLVNAGSVEFYGPTSVVGDFTNQAGGTLLVRNNQTLITGQTVNDGTIQTLKGTVIFEGGLVNNGVYFSDPSNNYFTDLIVNDPGYLLGEVGDNFFISGNFANYSLQNTLWNTRTASLFFNGLGDQNLYLAGSDLGALRSGYSDNFSWGEFTLGSGSVARFWDSNADADAALYVGLFALGGGLDQLASIYSDFNIYYDPTLAGNAYLGGQTYALNGAGFLTPVSAVPVPAAVWLFGSGLLGLIGVARRKAA